MVNLKEWQRNQLIRLNSLQNTIGDVKEELGKAFYPLIKSLADSAKGFLENKDNVDSLISGVKLLALGFMSIQSIKFGTNIGGQFGKIGKAITTLDASFSESTGLREKIKGINRELSFSKGALSALNEEINIMKKQPQNQVVLPKGSQEKTLSYQMKLNDLKVQEVGMNKHIQDSLIKINNEKKYLIN